jgi:TPR repeat protein
VSTNRQVAAYLAAGKKLFHLPSDPEARLVEVDRLRSELGRLFHALIALSADEDADVWFALGCGYSSGWGVGVDAEEAAAWLRKAADAGHAEAMVKLALKIGRLEEKAAREEAVAWFERAVALGSSSAMIWLGFGYRDGSFGLHQDPFKAIQWFSRAVDAGDRHAMLQLAGVHASTKNYLQAKEWLVKAAEEGFTEAHIRIADLCSYRGTPVYDENEATKWYGEAASGDRPSNHRATLELAMRKRGGLGTICNPAEAKWLLDRLLEQENLGPGLRRDAEKILAKMKTEFL